jgi:hypothetical protein
MTEQSKPTLLEADRFRNGTGTPARFIILEIYFVDRRLIAQAERTPALFVMCVFGH